MSRFARLVKKITGSKTSAKSRRAALQRRHSLLESLEDRRLMIATPAKFDFGPAGQSEVLGYTRIDHATLYSTNTGYGWDSNVGVSNDQTVSGSSSLALQANPELLRDFVRGTAPHTFSVNLPYGTYNVTLYSGHDTYYADGTEVRLEGTVVDTFNTAAGEYHTGVYSYASTYDSQTEEADTTLNLQLTDLGAINPQWRINGLEIVPSSLQINRFGTTTLNYNEGDPLLLLASAQTTVLNPDGTFNGGSLTISNTGTTSVNDVLEVQNQGTGAGQIGISGSAITYGGTTIGTISATSDGMGLNALSIAFNDASGAQVSSAAVQALVQAIGFRNVNHNFLGNGTRNFEFSLSDGDGSTAPVTRTVSVKTVNDPADIDLGAVVTYTTGGPAIFVAPAATVSDVDATSLATGSGGQGSLEIWLSANARPGDQLAISPQGSAAGQIGLVTNGSDLTVTYGGTAIGTLSSGSSVTGSNSLTLTFNTSATLAAVQALLRRVTLASSESTPPTSQRILSVKITEVADNAQATYTKAINETPSIALGSSVTFTEDQPAIFAAPQATVSDDNSNFASGKLTVGISANAGGADLLAIAANGSGAGQVDFVPNGPLYDVRVSGIAIGTLASGSGTVSGSTAIVINLNGSSTPAAVQAVLRRLTFYNPNNGVSPLTRTLSVTLETGDGDSKTTTQSIAVSVSNDDPTVNLGAASATYTENAAPILVSAGATVTDPDSFNLNSGVLTIGLTSNATADDRLAISPQGSAAGQIDLVANGTSYDITYGGTVIGTLANSGNGTVTGSGSIVVNLNASSTVAAVQALIRRVTLEVQGDNPSTLPRTLTVSLTDGDGGSHTAQKTLNITAVNDPPVSTADADYEVDEDQTLVVTALGVLANDFDLDNPLTAVLVPGEVPGTLHLYSDGSFDYKAPENYFGEVTFKYQAFDGEFYTAETTVTITVKPVNDRPVAGNDADYNVNEDATLTVSASGVLANDPDPDSAITADIVSQVLNGSLTLNLDGSFSYTPAPNFFGTDSFTYRAFDGELYSDPATVTITVQPVNDPPVLSGTTPSLSYTENDAAKFLQPNLAVEDVDSLNFDTGTLIVSQVQATDPLDRLEILPSGPIGLSNSNVTYDGTIIGSYSGGAGTEPLAITFNANSTRISEASTELRIQALLRSIAYRNLSDNPNSGQRTIRFELTDGDGGQVSTETTIDFTAVNDAPLIANVGSFVTYEEDGPPVLLVENATVTDPDTPDFSVGTLTVRHIDFFESTDRLSIQDQGTGAGQVSTDDNNVLYENVTIGTFTGGAADDPLVIDFGSGATPEIVQAVLRAIAYANVNTVNPSDADRIVEFNLTDGAGHGLATQVVKIALNNDDPVVTGLDNAIPYTENQPPVFLASGATFADLDSPDLAGATITVSFSQGGLTEDQLTVRATGAGSDAVSVSGSTVLVDGQAVASFLGGANGTDLEITFNGSATPASAQAVLRAVAYANTSDDPSVALRELHWHVTDGGGGQATADSTISISALNDPPTIENIGTAVSYTEDAAAVAIVSISTTTVSDIDSADLAGGSLTISGGLESTDRLEIQPTESGAGAITLSDNEISYSGVVIGTWTGGSGTEALAITLNSQSTPSAAAALLRAIKFRTISDNPNTAPRPLSITLTDGDGGSVTTEQTVNVNAVNDAPVITHSAPSPVEFVENGSAVAIWDGSISVSDVDSTDFAGGSLAVALANGAVGDQLFISHQGFSAGQIGRSEHDVTYSGITIGTWSGGTGGDALVIGLNASATAESVQALLQAIRFSNPLDDIVDSPRSVNFTLADGDGGSTIASQTVNVIAINDAPVAAPESYLAVEDTPLVIEAPGVLDNDVDAEHSPLTAIPVDGPAHGTLALNTDGSFTYTPAGDYNGDDSFSYRVSDGELYSGIVVVSLTVQAVNDKPVAGDDEFNTNEDVELSITPLQLLSNDSDVDEDLLSVVILEGPAYGPQHGQLVPQSDGSFLYTPDPNYFGDDSFTYQAFDGITYSDPVTVNVTIAAVNDAPVAIADNFNLNEDGSLTGNVLSNDSDAELGTLTVVWFSNPDPSAGNFSLLADGSLTFIPALNYFGTVTFSYKISDGLLESSIVTNTIEVEPVNDKPVGVGDAFATDEDVELLISTAELLANDSDVEEDILTVAILAGPSYGPQHGQLVPQTDGSFLYLPDPDYSGLDSFTYRAFDGVYYSDPVTVNITVASVNDAPVAAGESFSIFEDGELSENVLSNDSDVDTSSLTIIVVLKPDIEGFLLQPDGSLTFTPPANYFGTVTFTYKVTDGLLESAIVTGTIVVESVNDAPNALADDYFTIKETGLTIAAPGVLGNDTDVEGSVLTAQLGAGPSNGTLVLGTDGSFTYTPNVGFHGWDSFTYQASDGDAPSELVTVHILVRDQLTLTNLALDRHGEPVNEVYPTTSPAVHFTVAGDFTGTKARIEFDHGTDDFPQGDGDPDGSVLVTAPDVEGFYDPRIVDVGFPATGTTVLRYRLVQLDEAGEPLLTGTGEWQSLELDLQAISATAYIQDLGFVNDTGTLGDHKSSDVRIKGKVSGSSGTSSNHYTIEWASGAGSEIVAGRLPVSFEDLSFVLTPQVTGSSEHTIRFRVREWNENSAAYAYSTPWTDWNFSLEAPSAPVIDELKLVNGTQTDGVWTTTDPLLSGQVTLPEGLTTIAVQIDASNDGTFETTVYTDDQGAFEFRPPVSQAEAPQTVQARTALYDPRTGTTANGTSRSLTFTYNAVSLANVTELKLLHNEGDETNVHSSDPTVIGKISGGTTVADVRIEIDQTGDSLPDAWTVSDAIGGFTYRPTDLETGDILLRARTAQWDAGLGAYVYGSWHDLPFHLDTAMFTTGSVSVAVAKPLSSDQQYVTTDPAVTGTVTIGSASTNAFVTVEFNWDTDPEADGSTTTDASGNYVFVPIGLGEGSHTIKARTKEWNSVTREIVQGAWSDDFTYTVQAPANLPSTLTFGLASDSGSDPDDGITSNLLLEGQVNNPDGSNAGLAVEIDVNGDEIGDAIAFTDATGKFFYQVDGIAFGTVTINSRAVEWNETAGQYVFPATWTTQTFDYQPDAHAAARVVGLETVQVATNFTVTDPTIRGRVINDGSLKDIVIEFSTDGTDSTIEERVVTDAYGRFELQLTTLAFGKDKVIKVRAREFDPVTGELQTGGWASIVFSYLQPSNDPGTVSTFTLVEDTATPDDGHTANPAVNGEVDNGEGVAGVIVEIRHDQVDAIPDATVITDSDGKFTYTPVNLPYGTYTFEARVKEYNEAGGAIYGDWKAIQQFTYEADPTAAPKIASLTLASDTGISNTDRATSDPAVQGTVFGVTASVTIEFDHDGDGLPDGTATTDSVGNFSYSPTGLTQGFVSLKASLAAGATSLSGSASASLAFVYSSEPDGATAQALLTSYNTYANGWQQAQTEYENALRTAAAAYNNARYGSNSTYEGSLANAYAAREANRQAAQATYNQAVATADGAYATALTTAHTNFVSNLASFAGGVTTTFVLTPFAWPTTPSTNGLQIPSDGDQPTAPSRPAYDGAAYDWAKDPVYQKAVATAENSRREKEVKAEATYKSQKKTADDLYSSQLTIARQGFSQAESSAESQYLLDLQAGTNPIDLEAAKLESAAKVSSLKAAYERKLEEIDQWETSELQRIYDEDLIQGSYEAAVESRDVKILADAKRADADYAYFSSSESERATIENLEHDYAKWEEDRRIGAVYHKATLINAAAATRDKKIAEAERTHTTSLADAAKQYDKDMEHARVEALVANSTARIIPVDAWDLAVNTPWSTYYKALVHQDNDYISQVAPEYLKRYDDDLTAEHTAITTTAQKQEALSKDAADLRLSQADSDALSQQEFTQKENALQTTQAKDDNGSWKDYQTSMFKADRDFQKAETAANHTYDFESSASWGINAPYPESPYAQPLIPNTQKADPDFYWPRARIVVGDGATRVGMLHTNYHLSAAQNKMDREVAQSKNNAWHTYQAAMYLHEQTHRETTATNTETLDKAKADHAYTYATQFAIKYEAYLKAVSTADKTAANSEATNAKTYSDSVADEEVARNNAEAGAAKTYRVAVATDYVSLVTSWAQAVGTPWTALQQQFAEHEKTHIESLATAIVTYTSDVGEQATTWATSLNGREQKLANDVATATDNESGALAEAIKLYSDSVAQHRKDYAYSVATANKNHDQAVAQKDAAFKTGQSLRQRDYDNKLVELKFNGKTKVIGIGDRGNIPGRYDGYDIIKASSSAIYPYLVTSSWDIGGRISEDEYIARKAVAAIEIEALASDDYVPFSEPAKRPGRIAEFRDLARGQDEDYHQNVFAAKKMKLVGGTVTGDDGGDPTTVQGDVQAHRSWVVGVQDAHVTLAQEIKKAADKLADDLQTTTAKLASDQADAAETFATDIDTAEDSYTQNVASDDKTYEEAVAPFENTLTSDTTEADDTLREADTDSRGDYETALYQNHEQKLAAAVAPAGAMTSLKTYQHSTALADVTWAQGAADAANVREQRTTALNKLRLEGVVDAAGTVIMPGQLKSTLTLTTELAAASLAQTQSASTLLKTLNDSSAHAIRDAVAAVRAAEAADAARQVKAEKKYDLARVTAERDFQESAENASVTWANSVMTAEQTYWDAYESEYYFLYSDANQATLAQQNNALRAVTRDAAIELADDAYNQDVLTAQGGFATDIGDAQETRAHEITQSAQTRETDAGQAIVTSQTALNNAEDAYLAGPPETETQTGTQTEPEAEPEAEIVGLNETEVTYATSVGAANKKFAEDQAKLEELLTQHDGADNVEYATSLADANKTHAAAVAAAEADFHIAQAQAAASRQADAVPTDTSDPNYTYLQFRSAELTAQANWFVGQRSDFVAYATAMADASGDESVDQAKALGALANAQAAAQKGYLIDRAGRMYDEGIEDAQDDGAYALAEATVRHARDVDLPAKEKDLQVGYATMDETQLVAHTLAERDYQVAIAGNGGVATEAMTHTWRADRTAADYQWAVDYSTEDLEWTTGVAGADATYQSDLADKAYTYESGRALRIKDRAATEALARKTQALADAAAENTYYAALTTAANARRTAEYTAQANWLAADYAEQATQIAAIATAVSLPWADFEAALADVKSDWWAATGRTKWLKLATDLNTADTDYTTEVNRLAYDPVAVLPADQGWQFTVATAAYDFAVDSAADEYDRRLAEMLANKNLAVAQAGADKAYQIEQAKARNQMRTDVADLVKQHADEIDDEFFDIKQVAGYGDITNENAVRNVSAQDRWTVNSATGESAQLLAQATYVDDYATDYGTHWTTYEHAIINATQQRDLGIAEADRVRASALADAIYDYEEAHATSLALAVHNYATNNASPWASHADAVFAAERDHDIALADALRDQRVTDAMDDKTQAVARINAERALATALADSEIDRWGDEQTAQADHAQAEGETLRDWSADVGPDILVFDAEPAEGEEEPPPTPPVTTPPVGRGGGKPGGALPPPPSFRPTHAEKSSPPAAVQQPATPSHPSSEIPPIGPEDRTRKPTTIVNPLGSSPSQQSEGDIYPIWVDDAVEYWDARSGKPMYRGGYLLVDEDTWNDYRAYQAELELQRQYVKWLKDVENELRAKANFLIDLRVMEEAANKGAVRFVPDPNNYLGAMPRYALGAWVQDVEVEGERFKLVWALVPRPTGSGSPVVGLVGVYHVTDESVTSEAVAKKHFDRTTAAYNDGARAVADMIPLGGVVYRLGEGDPFGAAAKAATDVILIKLVGLVATGRSAIAAYAKLPRAGALGSVSTNVEEATKQILHTLRANGSKEALATAALIKRGKVVIEIRNYSGNGVWAEQPYGNNKIILYREALISSGRAAGATAHEAKHVLQRITEQQYHRGHEFEAFKWQAAVDTEFAKRFKAATPFESDRLIWALIGKNYRRYQLPPKTWRPNLGGGYSPVDPPPRPPRMP